ncbi:hypothetical protein C8R46DRAFT_1226042 [Mycena filopes]|nr:hypothetical protein C8R46DRAFT_1226042 [Mycena filopes]
MTVMTRINVAGFSFVLSDPQLIAVCCAIGALLALVFLSVLFLVLPRLRGPRQKRAAKAPYNLAVPVPRPESYPESPCRPRSAPCSLAIPPKAQIGNQTRSFGQAHQAFKPVALPDGVDAHSIGSGFVPVFAPASMPWTIIGPAYKYSNGHASIQVPPIQIANPPTEESEPAPASKKLTKKTKKVVEEKVFVRSKNLNKITTNVVFPKTSPFYTPSSDKENAHPFCVNSMRRLRAADGFFPFSP